MPVGLRWLSGAGFVRSIVLTGADLTFFTQMWVPLLVLLATDSMGLSKRLVPAGLLGRVNSASRTLPTAAVPLGALAGGMVGALADGTVAGAFGLCASF